ncbi:MAG TPA: hypothetical protein VGH32_14405, partial [Pirellulales bacterium]
RSIIATLLLSQGCPMLLGGDELSHTQQGNNNAYCQDNETSWLNWNFNHEQEAFLKFVQRVISLFHQQPVFHRRRFFHGQDLQKETDAPEILWVNPAGNKMSDAEWSSANVRCLGMQLFGHNIDRDAHGETITGDTMLLLYNADHDKPIKFKLPPTSEKNPWKLVFDTAREDAVAGEATDGAYELQPVSMVVFCAQTALREEAPLIPRVSPPAPE